MLAEADSVVDWTKTRKQNALRSKWGTKLEIPTNRLKNYPHQNPSPAKSCFGQYWGISLVTALRLGRATKRLLKIALLFRMCLSLSTPVEFSRNPDLNNMSSSGSIHKNVARIWLQVNGTTDLYMNKTKSEGYPWSRFPWKPSSHFIFRSRSNKFKLWPMWLHEHGPGTLLATRRLSTRITHWKAITSLGQLQDLLRTAWTSLKKK